MVLDTPAVLLSILLLHFWWGGTGWCSFCQFPGFLFQIPSLYFHFNQPSTSTSRGRHITVFYFWIQSVLTRVSPLWPTGSPRSGCTWNQLFISLPSCPVAKQSQAVSVQQAGSLCLSGNVIHFRRQAVVHCGGEAAYWAWWMESHRDIDKAATSVYNQPQRSHSSIIISHLNFSTSLWACLWHFNGKKKF